MKYIKLIYTIPQFITGLIIGVFLVAYFYLFEKEKNGIEYINHSLNIISDRLFTRLFHVIDFIAWISLLFYVVNNI